MNFASAGTSTSPHMAKTVKGSIGLASAQKNLGCGGVFDATKTQRTIYMYMAIATYILYLHHLVVHGELKSSHSTGTTGVRRTAAKCNCMQLLDFQPQLSKRQTFRLENSCMCRAHFLGKEPHQGAVVAAL